MATARKKQDEKHLKILRELVSLPANKQCFDCHQRGPTYVNMTIGSFVCTSCSGMLRGLTPPHRVKSISMASFSPEEVELIKARGNEYCKQIWLGLYDPTHPQDSKDEQQIKDFMVAKYERKRYYVDPTTIPRISASSNAAAVAAAAAAAAAAMASSAVAGGGNGGAATASAFSSPEAQLRSRSRTSTPQSVGGGSADGRSEGRPASGPPQPNHRPPPAPPAPLAPLAPLALPTQTSAPSHDNMFTPDKSSEFLADFGAADPFSSSAQAAPSNQPSFANFDNNPVFSSSSDQLFGLFLKSDPIPSKCNTNRWSMPVAPSALASLGNGLGNGLGSPARKATSTMGVNASPLAPPPSEDRYAALKDLDSLMKIQQQQPPTMATVPVEQTSAGTATTDWASAASPWPSVGAVGGGSSVGAAPAPAMGSSVFPHQVQGAFGMGPLPPQSMGFPETQSQPNPFAGVGVGTGQVAVDPWAPSHIGSNGLASSASASPFGANPFRPAAARRTSQPGFGPLPPEAGFAWGGAEAVPNGAILAGSVFPTSQSMNFPAKAWHSSVGNPFVLGASPAPTGRSSNPFL